MMVEMMGRSFYHHFCIPRSIALYITRADGTRLGILSTSYQWQRASQTFLVQTNEIHLEFTLSNDHLQPHTAFHSDQRPWHTHTIPTYGF